MSDVRNQGSALQDAMGELIEGTTVKRSRHDLRWQGASLAEEFRTELKRRGYLPLTVDAASVEPGERAPAFYLDGDTAYFGWIFWEKFSEARRRKLFGSVVRNAKGDWLIQISPRQSTEVYVNLGRIGPMDIDLPSAI